MTITLSSMFRKNLPWFLVACLALGAGVVLFLRTLMSPVDVLNTAQLEQLVGSNQIVAATLVPERSSPMADITGTYTRTDAGGNQVIRHFRARTLSTAKLVEFFGTWSGAEIRTPNADLLSVVSAWLPILLILPAIGIIIFLLARSNSRLTSPLPGKAAAPAVPARRCPQCGADLKPDAP